MQIKTIAGFEYAINFCNWMHNEFTNLLSKMQMTRLKWKLIRNQEPTPKILQYYSITICVSYTIVDDKAIELLFVT